MVTGGVSRPCARDMPRAFLPVLMSAFAALVLSESALRSRMVSIRPTAASRAGPIPKPVPESRVSDAAGIAGLSRPAGGLPSGNPTPK